MAVVHMLLRRAEPQFLVSLFNRACLRITTYATSACHVTDFSRRYTRPLSPSRASLRYPGHGSFTVGLVLFELPFTQQRRGYAKRDMAGKKKDAKSKKGQKPSVELSHEELNEIISFDDMKDHMEATIEYLQKEYAEQLSLRTSASAFDGLIVDTADGQFPLIQIAQIVQKNPQLIVINMAASPQYIPQVVAAIASSGLNVNPQQDGTSLFAPIPRVTREHREMLAKNAKTLCDKAKDKLRNIQKNYEREIKKVKDEHSADLIFNLQQTVLSETKLHMEKMEEVMAAKQKELLNE